MLEDHSTKSRRDDLESVIYILIYLYFGKLEWEYSMKINDIYEMKKNIIHNENIPECFRSIIMYSRSLEFDERPNYFYLMNLL